MPFPWQDAEIFRPGACIPCCPQEEPTPPADCACALLIPPFDSPYADYATAEGVVTDALVVTDCLAYYDGDTSNISSASSAFDGTDLTYAPSFTSPTGGYGYVWFSVSAKNAATITMATANAENIAAYLYDCAGNELEVLEGATPQTTSALPADGVYYLRILPNNPPPGMGTFSSDTLTLTSSDVFTPNPVIALWDDSGTTRQLEACPKMLLPPLTESTGDWYADCAAAATAITDRAASGCKGYYDGAVTASEAGFTATGTTSLALAVSVDETPLTCWGSVNCEGGETITITTSGGSEMTGNIYDDTGTLVESFTAESSPFTSAALPYTGRYTVEIQSVSNPPPTPTTWPLSATITSSGTMSVNEIAALFHSGLDCPSRLMCGDSCP